MQTATCTTHLNLEAGVSLLRWEGTREGKGDVEDEKGTNRCERLEDSQIASSKKEGHLLDLLNLLDHGRLSPERLNEAMETGR
jgi:hypothetical protein